MKNRPLGFLSEENLPHNNEVFDYVAELHAYLWRFVRVARPGASGNLGELLDDVIDGLEAAQHHMHLTGGESAANPTVLSSCWPSKCVRLMNL